MMILIRAVMTNSYSHDVTAIAINLSKIMDCLGFSVNQQSYYVNTYIESHATKSEREKDPSCNQKLT